MARDATSIYIDDTAVSVLSVSGRKARKWATAPLDPGLVRYGVIVHIPEVAAVLRKLWHSNGFTGTRVIAGISGINCLYRTIALPPLPKSLLPEAVRREAARVLGVSVEQLYLSWQETPTLLEEKTFFLAAAPKDSVDALIATLRRAGLNPYMMDLHPLALARAASQPDGILVDLQPTSLDIAIKVARVPEVIRTVPVSRTGTIEDKTAIVHREIERAVAFYNSVHLEHPLADEVEVLVSGQLSERQDLWGSIVGKKPHTVDALVPPLENTGDFDFWDYVTPIGLAFKETAEHGGSAYSVVNLNALPDVYRPKPRPLSDILYLPALVSGAALVVFAGYVAIGAHTHTAALREEWSVTNDMAVSLEIAVMGEVRALEERAATLDAEVSASESRANALDLRERLTEERRDDVNLNLGLINDTPAGLDLSQVKYDGDIVTVSGWGDGEEPVFSYANQLRSGGRFNTVEIASMSLDGVRMAFQLILSNVEVDSQAVS